MSCVRSSRQRLLSAVLLLAAFPGALSAQEFMLQQRLPYDAVPGEVVIALKSPAKVEKGGVWTPGNTVNLLSLLGDDAKVVHTMRATDGIVINASSLGDEKGMSAAIASLGDNPDVVGAERNFLYYADGRPNDPRVGDMWYLPDLAAFQAWDIRSDSPGIVVAVIDNGIQLDHEDLRGRIWVNSKEIPGNGIDDDGNGYIDDLYGWNFYERNANPSAEYVAVSGEKCRPHPKNRVYERHATHVAGTIGAVANNGRGAVGIAQGVRIMALKALGGPCGAGRSSDIMEAVAYAVKNGANIINMSLGGKSASKLLEREIQAAVAAGVVVVVAAGNEGKDLDREPRYPAAFPIDGLVVVSAIGPDGKLASFSNRGVKTADIGAPGVRILNAVPKGSDPRRAESDYAYLSGTSMATPIVTGAVALMRAQNPNLDPAEVERRLVRAALATPSLAGQVRAGGRLNLARLLVEAARPYQRPAVPVAQPVPPKPAPVAPAPVVAAPVPPRLAPTPKPAPPVRPTSVDSIRIEGPAADRTRDGRPLPGKNEIGGGALK